MGWFSPLFFTRSSYRIESIFIPLVLSSLITDTAKVACFSYICSIDSNFCYFLCFYFSGQSLEDR